MKPLILLVDEESIIPTMYKRAMEKLGLAVKHIREVDELFFTLERGRSRPDLIVLDIMMPWGTRYDEDTTDGGLRTGELVYQELREMFPIMPIIVLTNLSDFLVMADDVNLHIIRKSGLQPFDFADFVKETVDTAATLTTVVS